MATCHLITDTNLTLLSDVHLCHLDDATGEFIADGDGILFTHTLGIHLVEFAEIVDDKCTNHTIDASITSPVFQLKRSEVESCKEALRELSTLGNNFCTDVVLHTERGEVLGEGYELIEHDALEFVGLAVELIVDFLKTFFVFELFCTREFVNAAEEALVDHNTRERRIGFQRCVLHIACLVTKDGTKQLFFWSGIAFSLWSDLTDEDITRNDASTDTNNTIFIEILGSVF